ELDLLVVATITPDTLCPSTACWIQARLGARRALPFDVSASSTGFLVGLSVAREYLRSGAARRALVVAAEVVTRYVDWGDRENCFLWGDGAAAAVLEAGPGPGAELLALTLHADGGQADRLLLPGGGSRVAPITARTVETGAHAIRMQGPQIYRSSVRRLVEVCREILEEVGLPLEAVALLVPHQANLRIIEAVAARLPLPMDRVVVTIDYTGNCSGASLPLAFDAARRGGRLRAGEVALLATVGGGLIWGAGLVRM
ncbi:MAG: beta-ketoacyl-ACP synthase 3, partial [Candidatus Methylomirabilales bacterium]